MDAWIPVVGTLGGAIIGAGIAWLIERDRRTHEREIRWVADRRAIYANVIGAADTYHEGVLAWKIRSVALDDWRWPDREPFEAACHEAELLAPVAVLRPLVAMRTWVLTSRELREMDQQSVAFAQRLGEYSVARDRLVHAFRTDLGVAGGVPIGITHAPPRPITGPKASRRRRPS